MIHGAGTPIKMSEIATEFTGAAPHSLSEYYAGGPYVPASVTGIPVHAPTRTLNWFSNYYNKQRLQPMYIANFYTLGYTNDVVVRFWFSLISPAAGNHSLINPFGGWGHNGQGLNSFSTTTAGNPITAALLSQYTTVSCTAVTTSGRYGGGGMYQQPTAANNWVGVYESPYDEAGSSGYYTAQISLTLTP